MVDLIKERRDNDAARYSNQRLAGRVYSAEDFHTAHVLDDEVTAFVADVARRRLQPGVRFVAAIDRQWQAMPAKAGVRNCRGQRSTFGKNPATTSSRIPGT